MARGRESFIRRQKEIARQTKQKEKREARTHRGGADTGGDDDIAAIQAALDAGLNPGSAQDRLASVGEGEPEATAEGEDKSDDKGSTER